MVQRALLGAGYRIEGVRFTPRQLLQPNLRRELQFDDVVCRLMFDRTEPLAFIQVGAFDGVANDPLRKYVQRCGWRGVMLEPQPRQAARLRELYRDNEEITVLEAALDGRQGARTLYVVEADGLPEWAAQLASFDRDQVIKHEAAIPGLTQWVRPVCVECVTFSDVLDLLPDRRLDLLQIDAEGADGYLISLFPFDEVRPAIVHWERKNMTRTQQEGTLELLCAHGYQVAPSGDEDMLAVLADPLEIDGARRDEAS
jgi:FkbM family methyltransferase